MNIVKIKIPKNSIIYKTVKIDFSTFIDRYTLWLSGVAGSHSAVC